MDSDHPLTQIATKIEEGTSTPEEELIMLQSMNHSAELLLKFMKDVKAEHSATTSTS